MLSMNLRGLVVLIVFLSFSFSLFLLMPQKPYLSDFFNMIYELPFTGCSGSQKVPQ
jgi:hypothetical protein